MNKHLHLLITAILISGSLIFAQNYTNDLCNGGTAFDGGGGGGTGTTFGASNAFANHLQVQWYGNDPWLNSYIGYDFGASNTKTIQKYTLNGTGGGINRASGWIFQGSNNFSNWTDLDTQTNQNIGTGTVPYTFINSTSYRYYRFVITQHYSGGGNAVVISEIEMMEQLAQYSGGDGTIGDPYQIANQADVITLSNTSSDWDAHFIQTANITMTQAITPIGNISTNFSGSYDGDNFTITSLSVSQSSDYAGMFGYIDNSEIKNLTLSTLNISGGENYAGGLAGKTTESTITNITVTGTVTGKYELGGMIGEAKDTEISNCTASNISVTSSGGTSSGSNIGGLVGLLSTSGTGSISSSSSSGTVTSDGGEDVGGLIGESQVNVTNCSSGANVNAVDFVGGLIGFTDGGTIQGSSSSGNVEGDKYVGGLIGDADGNTINNCSATGTVSVDGDDEDYIGGLIGRADNCIIYGSYSAMNAVTGDDYTGGFIGYALNGCNIDSSYAIVTTVTGYDNTGGFIGENDASNISRSYSTSAVNADGDNAGGFIGLNDDSDGTPEVKECYSTGNVDGTDEVDSDDTGGFIGENWGIVENCYSTGNVSKSGGGSNDWFGAFMGNNKSSGTVKYCYTIGNYNTAAGNHGFIWGNSGTVTSNFYDSEVSSQTSGTGATGKSSTEMKQICNYISAAWDFEDETDNGNNDNWTINSSDNNGYPALSWQDYTNTQVQNPTNGGTISQTQIICYNTAPDTITNSVYPTSESGSIEYKWLKSTTSNSAGFDTIPNADSAWYNPGNITDTTWYKRIARVECCADWSGAAHSNVVMIGYEASPVVGTFSKTPDAVLVPEADSVFAVLTPGSSGNGLDVLEYRNKNKGQMWSNWATYSSGTKVDMSGLEAYEIRTFRAADYCNNSDTALATWWVSTPETQATNIKFLTVNNLNVSVNWTIGSGAKRAVFVAEMSSKSSSISPEDSVDYNANSIFGYGDQIGSTGYYCVYNGTGNSLTIEGLTPNTEYRLMVCEYNEALENAYYNKTETTFNPSNVQTVPIKDWAVFLSFGLIIVSGIFVYKKLS